MSFKVAVSKRVRKDLASWGLPDSILVDVYLRLQSLLANNPAQALVRLKGSLDGMVLPLEIIDPDNRISVYRFLFYVVYGQDEETIHVMHAAMSHTFGI